jgi:hypothetical protein
VPSDARRRGPQMRALSLTFPPSELELCRAAVLSGAVLGTGRARRVNTGRRLAGGLIAVRLVAAYAAEPLEVVPDECGLD